MAEEYERLTDGTTVEHLNRVLYELDVGRVSLPLFLFEASGRCDGP
jgi:hypothetical protein